MQAVADTPLCLDSANPQALTAAIEAVDKTPMINSLSGEPARLEGILPLVAEHGCRVIALAMDEVRIPETSEVRVKVHFTAGLSNISFGLPARSFINRAFLTLALAAGLDSAILDPLDQDLRAALLAAELVLGRDDYCLNYTRAYRAGLCDGSGKGRSRVGAGPLD